MAARRSGGVLYGSSRVSSRVAQVRPVLARYGPLCPGSTNAEIIATWAGCSARTAAGLIYQARRLGMIPEWVRPDRMLRPEPPIGIEAAA